MEAGGHGFSGRRIVGETSISSPAPSISPGHRADSDFRSETGSDIDPVATTDSSGKVWVAWQGWRDGRAAILPRTRTAPVYRAGENFQIAQRTNGTPPSPPIRAGRVAVAWDSYRNGNYDVYARTWSNSWGAEVPIAASARYEAYPSIAFDPKGRLWVAYEEGGKGWGKDLRHLLHDRALLCTKGALLSCEDWNRMAAW